MNDCPHCGEAVPEKAAACPHCGSDFETGWNPEADYYSLELPEDDDEGFYSENPNFSPPPRVETLLPIAGIVLTAGLFLWLGRRYEGPGHIFAFLLLTLCCWLFFRGLGRPR